MIWASWRQQRTETLIAVGILAVLAALAVPTGLEMASAYHHDGLSACLGVQTTDSCNEAIRSFTSRFESLGNLLAWVTIVPGLIGILLAAPFLLELENGTYRLAWTQSITRGRWILSKLSLAVGATVLAAVALTALMTWWRTPFAHLQGRMDTSVFDSEGTVVVGYALFALGLALLAGVIWRRAVPALIVAFAGYMAARIFVDTWLRQRFMSPLSAIWPITQPEPAKLNHAWILSQSPSDTFGHDAPPLFGVCVRAIGSTRKLISPRCLAEHGAGYSHAVYHPASRFWAFQGIETSLFAGVALILIVVAAWWTHERTT